MSIQAEQVLHLFRLSEELVTKKGLTHHDN